MNLPGRPAPDHPTESPEPSASTRTDPRRIDEIFGDVLPDVTGDERDVRPASDRVAEDDRWYLDNRPPHHG